MKVETDGSGREINEEIILDSIRRMLKQERFSFTIYCRKSTRTCCKKN